MLECGAAPPGSDISSRVKKMMQKTRGIPHPKQCPAIKVHQNSTSLSVQHVNISFFGTACERSEWWTLPYNIGNETTM